MVLEESSSPQEPSATSFTESFPTNDIDTYSGDRNPAVLQTRDPSFIRVSPPNAAEPIYVNLSTLPKPWGLFGPQAHPQQLIKAVADSCTIASEILGRPVQQEEADALAYHLARSVRIGSVGGIVGMSLAGAQAFRTRGTYRFPGWTPGDNWRAKGYPDVFGPLKGQRARMSWHLARFTVYGFVGAMLGQVFFGSYALTTGSAGRMMDPRLKEFSMKVRERMKSGQGGASLPGGRQVDATAAPRDNETFDMARQRQRVQQGSRNGRQQRRPENSDDVSPTGGSFGSEYANFGSQEDTGMLSDDQVAKGEYQKQREQSRTEADDRWALSTGGPRQQSFSDDASQAMESASSQSGSAWERLRQQAASGAQSPRPSGSTPTPSRRREGTSNGDSFAFSQSNEDRQLARAEAQEEFNKRIEREREGQNFDDRGAGRGGWRS